MKEPNYKEGELLLIDKPKTWTSFDVVNKIRFKIKHKLGIKKIKVGHAGTLDPLATGLLIICTGKFTKKLASLQGLQKEYTGTICLGATTPSYDAETEIDGTFPTEHITKALVEETVKTQFLGDIDQYPPMFSAIKVDGQRLYKKARKGEKVELKTRAVHIFEFEITKFELPYVGFRVVCSKGTYVRSLAFDFGKALNSGGYLSELCRTQIGDYDLKDAWNLETFVKTLEE